MLASRAVNSDSFKVTTPSETDIHFSRIFDAPRRLVFEAMTKPEHVKEWWGRLGEGYSVPVCEIDLRIGGMWRFVNRHPKGEAAFHGAASRGHDSGVQYLADQGAAVNPTNKNGRTPLAVAEGEHFQATYQIHQSTADLLRKPGGPSSPSGTPGSPDAGEVIGM